MRTRTVSKGFTKKIIWAVDPFHEAPKEQLRAAKAIQYLFEKTPIIVQPVSMLLSGRYNPEERVFLEDWEDLQEGALKNLEKLLRNLKLEGLQRPRLEKQTGTSISRSVLGLLDLALEEEADFIVVSSHARKGAARWILGSFAETLVLESPIPVLVINPKVNPTSRLRNILFPTDFSEASRQVYEDVVKMAKRLDCKILLFHKIQYLYPSFGYPFVVPPVSKDSIQNYIDNDKSLAEDWVRSAKMNGVVTKAHISSKTGYAVDDIVKAAKKLGTSGMIAMASQSGRLSTVLLGSLTRQVLRHSPCPVLVIHPDKGSLTERTVEGIKKVAIDMGQHPLIT